jgi:hypothetical protein
MQRQRVFRILLKPKAGRAFSDCRGQRHVFTEVCRIIVADPFHFPNREADEIDFFGIGAFENLVGETFEIRLTIDGSADGKSVETNERQTMAFGIRIENAALFRRTGCAELYEIQLR